MKLNLAALNQDGWYGIDVAHDSVLHYNWDYSDVAVWCRQTYGMPGFRKDLADVRWRDQLYDGVVWFRNEADRNLFMLKWA